MARTSIDTGSPRNREGWFKTKAAIDPAKSPRNAPQSGNRFGSHADAKSVQPAAAQGRMPVILDPDSYDLWLDPGMRDVRAASELLKPYDARLMRCIQ